jgi:hypothetical protein
MPYWAWYADSEKLAISAHSYKDNDYKNYTVSHKSGGSHAEECRWGAESGWHMGTQHQVTHSQAHTQLSINAKNRSLDLYRHFCPLWLFMLSYCPQ